jgi:hypothetical protein
MSSKIYKLLSCTIILSLFSLLVFAQGSSESTEASMQTVMRSNGKIYVVMAVCITILVVLFLYLIRIDTKVSKKEKDI